MKAFDYSLLIPIEGDPVRLTVVEGEEIRRSIIQASGVAITGTFDATSEILSGT